MAAGGLTESLLGASDEIFNLQCEICQKKGDQREAKHFCENCNSYICESCKTIHSRIPDLRQHKLSPAVIQHDCGLCINEGNKIKADHFCKTCKSYICSVCMDAHGTFDALKHHIIVSGKSMLQRHDPSASDDVSNKFSHLSTSEMTNCPTKSNKRKYQKSTQKPWTPVESVGGARSSTDTSIGSSTDTSVQRQTNALADMTVQRQTKPLADMTVQRQFKALADMTVRTLNKINVKLENDTSTPSITGCCFMPGGKVVLCDYWNCKIKLLNRSLTLRDCLTLQGSPHDVADLDGSSIAVTLPFKKQVQLIKLLPTVKIGRTVSVDLKCYGIVVAGETICVSGTDGTIRGHIDVYDISWTLKKRLGIDQDGAGLLRLPDYIAVSQTSGSAFVSNNVTDTVTCLSSDNKILWRYTLRGPCGLYVDSHDNIIVCNYGNHSVDILTAEGKRYKTPTLLSSRYRIERPRSVAFRPDDQTLVVGSDDSGIINVYKLS